MELPQIIDLLDETIYLSDLDTYEMLYINKAGLESIGSRITLPYKGQPCYRVLQGQESPCSFCTNHLLTEDRFYVWENTNALLGKHFLLKDKLICVSGRRVRMEVAIDITEKEQVSESVREKLESELALVSCLRYISPPNSFEEGVRMVLGELGAFHRADRAYIIEFDHEENLAVNTYEWCTEGVKSQKENLQSVSLEDLRMIIDLLEKDRLFSLDNVESLRNIGPAAYRLLHMQGIRSLLTFPLCVKDEVVGLLGVDNPRRRQDSDLMESLSFFLVSDLKKRRVEEELFHTRQYDSLTELKNYDSYIESLDYLRVNPPASLGVVTADINALKQINQRYGPAYGDTYIGRVARLLEQAFPGGSVFRVGGDEFEVLWNNVPHAEFMESMGLFEHLIGNENDFTVSVGSTWADQNVDVDMMINYADRVLSLRKQDYYQTNQEELPNKNTLLQETLQASLKAGQFLPYLQPKADTETGEITGAEMLVRRLDPERGIVPPAEFIICLENEGLIKHLDFYMIEQTCSLLAGWVARGARPIRISVNVSRVTLMEPGFLQRLLEIRCKYAFPQQCLELEVTERVGKIERETLLETVASLRREGFSISLDDFGAEYSNLSLLTMLEVDVVKLDKSLIDGVAENKKSAALAECIVNLCHKFGMKCIAEGVETQTQRAVMRRFGCDDIQGYLLSKPIPIQEFEKKYENQLFDKARALREEML